MLVLCSEEWATYFDKLGVDVVFFSAAEEQLRLVPGWTMPVSETSVLLFHKETVLMI